MLKVSNMTNDIPTNCSHCGCHITAHFPTESPMMSRYIKYELDEIASINKEVLQAEKVIRILRLTQSSILQRLNHLQSPPSILPTEILARIFEIAATSDDDTNKLCSYLLHKLGEVSTYWRYVILSVPRLFGSACLEHLPQMECGVAWRDQNVAFLRSYFERAKGIRVGSLDLGKRRSETSGIHCGCTNLHSTIEIAPAPFISKSDEIISLNEEFLGIEKDIGVLQLSRSLTLERLNDIQSPPDTLPPEVLSYIFELVLSTSRDDSNRSTYIPLRLSAVSAYWRYVVHLTPQLWTSIHLQTPRRVEVTDSWRDQKISLLRYYIERAKGLPLSLYFKTLYRWKDNGSDTNSKAIVDVFLKEFPTRIKSLQLISTMPVNWFDLPSDNSNDEAQIQYPHLETLEVGLDNFYYTTDQFKLPISPILQHLKLHRSLYFTPSFIGTKLTSLHLVEMPYMLSIWLLLSCKDTLVEYQCRKQLSYDPMGFDRVPFKHEEVITLPRLETLGWQLTLHEEHVAWDRSILVNFDTPVLRNLYLIGRPMYSEQINLPESNLFTRILSPLSTVGLCPDYPVNVEEGEFDHYMDLMNTERLILGSRYGKWKGVVESLDPLCNVDRRKRLPKLKVLSFPIPSPESPYHGWAEPYEDMNKCGDMVQMLEQRLSPSDDEHLLGVSNEPFILQLPRNKDGSEIRWRKYEQRVQALVDAGLLRVETCDYHLDMFELGPFM